MATQKPKNPAPKASKTKDTQEDLDKSPSRRKAKVELTEEEKADIAATKEHQEAEAAKKNGGVAPAKRKAPINDEVTKFLSEVKSNADAISKTKKHEYFGTINTKAFAKLVEQKDDLGGGLFRMRLGNMLRGARSKSEKMVEKAKAAKAKATK